MRKQTSAIGDKSLIIQPLWKIVTKLLFWSFCPPTKKNVLHRVVRLLGGDRDIVCSKTKIRWCVFNTPNWSSPQHFGSTACDARACEAPQCLGGQAPHRWQSTIQQTSIKCLTSRTILIGLWGVPNLETHPCDWNHPKKQARGDPCLLGYRFLRRKFFLFHTVPTVDGRNPAPGNGIFSISTGACRISSIKKTTFSLKNQLGGVSTQPTQIHHLEAGFDGFLKEDQSFRM